MVFLLIRPIRHQAETDSLASVQILLQVLGLLTLVRVDRGSREKVLREGHIPDIYSALSSVIVLMKSRRVDHSCIIRTTCCLGTTNHVNPTLHIMLVIPTLHIMHVNPTLHTTHVEATSQMHVNMILW